MRTVAYLGFQQRGGEAPGVERVYGVVEGPGRSPEKSFFVPK